MTNAERNRSIAVGMLIELYIPTANDFELRDASRDEIAGNIDKLAQLGRTDRWQAAIKRWAAMVREPGNNIRWALIQGCVYAGHAI